MITKEQIKAARAMLDMKQADLARKAEISLATLNNIERGAQDDPRTSTMLKIRQTLEREGIEFIGRHGSPVTGVQFSGSHDLKNGKEKAT